MNVNEMSIDFLKENYNLMSLDDKLVIAKESKDPSIVEYLFYDETPQIRFFVAQNEYLPISKLKRLARDTNQDVREIAIVMYERRLIY